MHLFLIFLSASLKTVPASLDAGIFICLTQIIVSVIIVAKETVAGATIIEVNMSKFMKILNNISRSQAIYRSSKISAADLQSGHFAYALAICREPGRSQEELAEELCVNKSTVARNLNYLEEHGYIKRTPLPNDKRQVSVHPTEKMLAYLPEISKASDEWMEHLSENIPEEDLLIFDSVLLRMQKKAKEIIENQEADK